MIFASIGDFIEKRQLPLVENHQQSYILFINNDCMKGNEMSTYGRYGDRYDPPYYNHEARDGFAGKLVLLVLSVIFPPLAVFFMYGFRGEFWLSVLLWILFYIPSLIYAVWLIARR